MRKKSQLRGIDRYRDVYLTLDRTPDERKERRDLVEQLKERQLYSPGRRFVIKGSEVVVVEPLG